MFNNLQPREKTLAFIVIALGLLTAATFGANSYMQAYRSQKDKLLRLEEDLNKIELTKRKAAMAMKRRDFYRETSLPADQFKGRAGYGDWLENLVEEKLMPGHSINRLNSREIKFEGRPLATEFGFRIQGKGNLRQVVELLHQFYATNYLHRIETLVLTPPDKASNTKEKDPDAKYILDVDMSIKALALTDANAEHQIALNQTLHLRHGELQNYIEMIVKRNLLNRENHSPEFTNVRQTDFNAGGEIRFDVSANDSDGDRVQFQLLETKIEGARLTQGGSESMSASFSARSVPPGRYDLKIRVSDGAPYPKFVDKVITINVKKPEPREEPKKEEPKEVKRLIDRATVSTITAIVQDKDGNERVWLDDKIGGKKYRLGVGDKFEIGSVSGVIKSIKKNVVEVEVASGKVVTYRLGDKLSKPQPDKSL